MKGSKVSASFVTKFSSYLSKFKQTSTINVAHDQIRKIFSQYKYSDIAVAFISKMDSCDQLNEKQKKQHSKVYLTLIDVYGQDVVLQHYERLIQSMVKKTVGISEVVGHLCKTLLNRIYPVQNISNYVKHLLVMFKQHMQIPKIIKQIMESIDASLTQQFQTQMLTIIAERINMQKSKVQCLQAILAIILSLENKFSSQIIVQSLIVRNLKNQDWNTRKLCVDISYALLVIRQQANETLHHNIKQMKYDKIKHVREAVSNYYVLYKQIYGDQSKKNEQPVSQKKISSSKVGVSRSPTFRKTIGGPVLQPTSRSLQKNVKKSRNQQFFQQAKNKDVIKMPEENKSLILPKEKIPASISNSKSWNKEIPSSGHNSKQKNTEKDIDFQNYLKNRPKNQFFEFIPNDKILSQSSENPPLIVPRVVEREENTFRKKEQESEIKFQSPLADSSLSLIEESNQNIKAQILTIKDMFSAFEEKVMSKMSDIDNRVAVLQKKMSQENFLKSKMSSSQVEESFDNRFNKYHHKINESSASQVSLPTQSNLQEKVKQSINKNNWDEAFALVLANNRKTLLFELLTHCRIPSDKLVVDCLFMEVRKQLKSCISLKWILTLLQETEVSQDKLKKLRKQLERINNNLSEDSESRNYFMLKNLLLNQIDQKLKS